MDITPDAGLADYFSQHYSGDLNTQLRGHRFQALDTLVRPYTDTGHAIYTKVATGTPFIEVVHAVQRNGDDLVIKVAQHDNGLARAVFGSTGMHLLRKCPCPVWIDRPTLAYSANNSR